MMVEFDPAVPVSSRPPPTLPLEICEHIIDFCAYDSWASKDLSVLYTCALTTKTWFPRSRMHLYSDVCLPTERHFNRLLETLHENPSFSLLVIDLNVGTRKQKDPPRDVSSSTTAPEPVPTKDPQPPTWIALIPLRLLPILPKVKSLTFYEAPPFNGTTDMFLHQAKTTGRSIITLTLHSCVFMYSRDLLRLISCFPGLDSLRLYGVVITNLSPSLPNRYINQPPSLTMVSIGNANDHNFFDFIATCLTHHPITSLQYWYDSALPKWLPFWSPSLRGVGAYFAGGKRDYQTGPDPTTKMTLPENVDFSAAHHLRHIDLSVSMTPGAERFLDVLQLPACLTWVRISFWLCAGSADLVLSLNWDKFDSDLSHLDDAYAVNVRLVFKDWGLEEEDKVRLRAGIEEVLPKSRKAALVSVEFRSSLDPTWS